MLRNLYVEEDVDTIKEKSKPKNLQEFMESEEFTRTIRTAVDISVGEIFLMILKFSILNSLSVTGMTNLFKLINSIFVQPILPESRYITDELLNSKGGINFYAVCHNCSSYIGKFGELQSVNSCDVCHIDLDLTNPSNTSFFVIIDPSKQLSDLLKVHGKYYNEIVNERQHEIDHIKDIYDGNVYREFVNSLSEEDQHNYATAIFNTDGAPKFKCSQYSIWPIYLMVNELPAQERLNNLMTCGLWFSKKKTEMSSFLEPFVDLINELQIEGIKCTVEGEERPIKLYVNCCCVDSVARAPVQGIKQFNGHFGCSWCLHPGIYAHGTMKYPLLTNGPPPRNEETTLQEMLNIDLENPEHGIKYPSPLINLRSFKIVSGFVPDYLHCYLEGVAAQFTDYYLSEISDNEIKRLDSMLKSIAVPYQISRLSRPISNRNDWKAREWENFILYYSVPLFSAVLSKKLLHHWLLFAESLHILLQTDIHINELDRADKMLNEFVIKSEEYFEIRAMSFNLHQLLHICTSVLNFGPLWAHSTFGFESANHYLLKAVKCARGVPQQIIRFVNINHSVMIMQEKIYLNVSDTVKLYCDEILSAKIRSTSKISTITYFGNASTPTDNIVNNLQISEHSQVFLKIVKDGCVYVSYLKSTQRINNSFAQLKDKRYIRIHSFIADDDTKKELTICNVVHTRNSFKNNYNELKIIQKIDEEQLIIPTIDIEKICVLINLPDHMYICNVPNLLHY